MRSEGVRDILLWTAVAMWVIATAVAFSRGDGGQAAGIGIVGSCLALIAMVVRRRRERVH